MHPILAASFAGIEIMFILSALIVTTVVGFASGFWQSSAASPMHLRRGARPLRTDAVLGCVGVAVAAPLLCLRRRRKDDPDERGATRNVG